MIGNERGSALIEIIGVGAAVVVVLIPVLVGVGRVQRANDEVSAAAHAAALAATRTGDPAAAERHAAAAYPGTRVDLDVDGDRVVVTVSREVDLLGAGGVLERTVTARAAAHLSPYRSGGG